MSKIYYLCFEKLFKIIYMQINVKNNKKHCNQIVPDTVPISSISLWFNAALVRLKFYTVVALGVHQTGHDQGKDREADRH